MKSQLLQQAESKAQTILERSPPSVLCLVIMGVGEEITNCHSISKTDIFLFMGSMKRLGIAHAMKPAVARMLTADRSRIYS